MLDVKTTQLDRLEFMFTKQHELQARLGTLKLARSSPIMAQHYIDKMLLAIHEEAVEIARETLSKHVSMPFGWKQTVIGDEEKYRAEIIDLWHFTMNLWLVIGGTADEFYALYLEKNKINHQRQNEDY